MGLLDWLKRVRRPTTTASPDDALVESLRAFATEPSWDIPDEEELDLGILRGLLPSEPMAPPVLDRVLHGLSDFHQARLVRRLGRLGRTEILTRARIGATWEKNAYNRLSYAEALAYLSESEGLAALEALYRESVLHRDDLGQSVPLPWILGDVLTDNLGTPAALALSNRLREAGEL
jgi:hypothetical protein